MGETNCMEKLPLDDKENPREPDEPDKVRCCTFKENERQRIYELLRKPSILLFMAACGIIVVFTVISFSVSMFMLHEYTWNSHEVLKSKTSENQQMTVQQNEKLLEEINKLQLSIHNIEKLSGKQQHEINKLQQEMTKTVQNITDLINLTTENTMSIVKLQSILHNLRNKTEELEKQLNIVEQKTALLQYEHTDLKSETEKNLNLIGYLQNKNNDLVSKIDTLERTTSELKRQLAEIQKDSTYTKRTRNGTDHISKPPAWTVLFMLVVSCIILHYGYF